MRYHARCRKAGCRAEIPFTDQAMANEWAFGHEMAHGHKVDVVPAQPAMWGDPSAAPAKRVRDEPAPGPDVGDLQP